MDEELRRHLSQGDYRESTPVDFPILSSMDEELRRYSLSNDCVRFLFVTVVVRFEQLR